jgi:drug/metabolite transporter (DMT)-like permease
MPGWEVISWAVVVSLPVLLPATVLLWPETASAVPWPSWAGLLYVALVSQYLGFFLWNSALAFGGVARIGQIQLLQIFATLAVAALLLGETIDLRMILFATAVVAVVALGLWARVGARASQGASDQGDVAIGRRA